MRFFILTKPGSNGRKICYSMGVFSTETSAQKHVNFLNYHYDVGYRIAPV